MKRLLLCALLLVLVLTGCAKKNHANKVPAPLTLAAGEAAENVTDFAVIDGKLWVAKDGAAVCVGSDETVEVPADFHADYIASDGNSPVLCAKDGRILWDGEVVSLPEEEITSFAVAGNTAVYTYSYTWNHPKTGQPWNGGDRIGFYNRANGDFISQDPPNQALTRVFSGDTNSIWITNRGEIGSYLYRVRVDTMKTDAVYDRETIQTGAWNPSDARFWTLNESYYSSDPNQSFDPEDMEGWTLARSMMAFDPLTNKTEYSTWTSALTALPVKIAFSGDKLIVLDDRAAVTVWDDWQQPADEEKTLTVLVVGHTDQYSIPADKGEMDRLGPICDALGIRLTVKALTGDQIRAKLLAGDTDFDLYKASTSWLYADKPFWEPLEGYEAIAEKTELLLPEIVDLCSYGGHLYGIPYSGHANHIFWCVRDEAAEKIGLTREEMEEIGMLDGTWTFDDYLALARRAKDAGYPFLYYMLSLRYYAVRYFDPYGTGDINDPDGAVLRRYLEIRKALRKEGLLREFDRAKEDPEQDDPDVLLYRHALQDTIMGNNEFSSGGTLVLEPTFDGVPAYPVEVYYYGMNAHSQHKETAAKVLAEILDPANDITRSMALGFNQFFGYQSTGDTMKTPEAKRNWELYREAMRSAVAEPLFLDEWLYFANEEEEKYLNDEQDLDYTVKRILDRAGMILKG
ncbi:MAG: carbohydrate ABC transporter substrate-binding protein [Clostridia bacterium]|nr:carbohydrate ABC transporter substrate-binding protein [Clostridia bacterium]